MKRELRSFISGVTVTLLAVALLYFVAMIIPSNDLPARPDSFSALRKAREIQRLVVRNYLGEIDEKTQAEYMAVGQVAALGDPYSRYYTKEQFESLRERRQGEYIGIGINFTKRSEDGRILVLAVQEGTPAMEGGLMEGDLILSIAGNDTVPMETSEITEFIQSHEGEALEFVVRREGEAEDVRLEITPGPYQAVTVKHEILEDGIGYLAISQFSRVTVEQFDEAMKSLEEQGMQRLILDLRDNGGGLVETACEIARRILPEGVIVYEEDKSGDRKYHENDEDAAFDYPLVVLVNENTASAAEILTGAIKDYGTGVVVGQKTYGKGIVQNYYTLEDGSVLQLTTTHYFTPEGNNIHETGIAPAIEAADDANTEQDEALDQAIIEVKKI